MLFLLRSIGEWNCRVQRGATCGASSTAASHSIDGLRDPCRRRDRVNYVAEASRPASILRATRAFLWIRWACEDRMLADVSADSKEEATVSHRSPSKILSLRCVLKFHKQFPRSPSVREMNRILAIQRKCRFRNNLHRSTHTHFPRLLLRMDCNATRDK